MLPINDILIGNSKEADFLLPKYKAHSRLGKLNRFLAVNRSAPLLLEGEMKIEPWIKTYNGITRRCNYKKSKYYKKGIKDLTTKKELKKLWFRDKAYLMKRPSIDRKNSKGNYTLKNCRYTELSDNSRKGAQEKWAQYKLENRWSVKYDKCIVCNTRDNKHHSRGECIKCYAKHYNKYYWFYIEKPQLKKLHEKQRI